MPRHFASTVLVLSLLVVFSTPIFAQAPPSADSYVTTAMPTANFGNSSILPVQSGTTSYVQLNLGAFPANARIAKATLRLYVDAVTAPGAFDVYTVNGNWSERGLTSSNAPALGASATGGQSIAISKSSVNQFVLVDITSLVQGWLDGSVANHGVALALTTSSGSFAFDSKEASGHHPELEVVLAGAEPLILSTASGATAGTAAAISGTAPNTRMTALGIQQNAPDPYVDNGTALQVGANFNIDGTGTAAFLNAVSGYQLNGAPLISQNGYLSQSLGLYAGPSNTGNLNTFAGVFAGSGNTTGAFNTVVGAQANAANGTGNYNTVVGAWAGLNNTGTNNAFYGAYAGYSNTTGVNNMFFGTNAGHNNTTGNGNFFLGAGSGYNNTTGLNNTFLGYLSGQNADATASNNLYVGSQGAPGESNTIRIGDASNQIAAYIAGVNGAPVTSGVPVYIDSTGKLGTSGMTQGVVTSFNGRSGQVTAQVGDYTFPQIAGTLANNQLSGAYGSPVTLSNSGNSFTGNGSGLVGVHPAPGSGNYIQNTNNQQNASMNITGGGTFGGMITASSGMSAYNSISNSVAVYAEDDNTTGGSAGVEGKSLNPNGVGVFGHVPVTTGLSAGVQGESKSTTGIGVLGVGNSKSGQNFGVLGYADSTAGFGVMGVSPSIGTAGSTQMCTALNSCTLTTGIAGQFFTATGGTILQGASGADLNSLVPVFNVDSAGKVTAAGIPNTTISTSAVYVDSAGHLGIQSSSIRFKEQIQDMGTSSSALMKLRPVTFFYKPQFDDGSHVLQYGLIAEEVAKIYPELVAYDRDGQLGEVI